MWVVPKWVIISSNNVTTAIKNADVRNGHERLGAVRAAYKRRGRRPCSVPQCHGWKSLARPREKGDITLFTTRLKVTATYNYLTYTGLICALLDGSLLLLEINKGYFLPFLRIETTSTIIVCLCVQYTTQNMFIWKHTHTHCTHILARKQCMMVVASSQFPVNLNNLLSI